MHCHAASVGPVSIELVEGAGFLLLGHTHETPHLLIVLDGELAEDGHCLRRGAIRFSPPGDEHFVRGLDRARMLLILGDCMSCAVDARITSSEPGVARLGELVAGACHRPDGREGLSAAVDDLLATTASVCARNQERIAPVWLTELRRLVQHGDEASRNVTALARRAGVSREHLARSFRGWYGTSLSEFLRDRRLARAWRRLVTTDWPLADVAIESGFADQSHLTRQMHAAYGLTPGTLRGRSGSGITFVQDPPDPPRDAFG